MDCETQSYPAGLADLGWDGGFAGAFAPWSRSGREPGRVLAGEREALRVATGTGERQALLPGRLLYTAASPVDLPCAGDWLVLRRLGPDEPLLVEAVLPRRTLFLRRAAGRRSEPQALAANVDVALLVSGLDRDWSPRRLERWLALAREARVAPVVVLTKADLCSEEVARQATAAASALAPRVPVHAVDARTEAAVEALTSYLGPGRTVALLGSSGVGKSTLVNRLVGRPVVATAELAADDRGRHTTTRRELLFMPTGGLLLDTPGLREVGLWLGEEPLAAVFPEIAALARHCRFRDCAHGGEPGCAVGEAVAKGELPAERLASLRRLQGEEAALLRRTDPSAAREEKRRWRAIHREAKRHKPRLL